MNWSRGSRFVAIMAISGFRSHRRTPPPVNSFRRNGATTSEIRSGRPARTSVYVLSVPDYPVPITGQGPNQAPVAERYACHQKSGCARSRLIGSAQMNDFKTGNRLLDAL